MSVKGFSITTRITRDPFQLMTRRGYKWFGVVPVEIVGREVHLWMTGIIAQWLNANERVRVVLKDEPKR